MKQIVIKKWIDGEFREVKRYSEEEVVSIRHHTDGLEVILKGNIRLYDTQCIIEFEEKGDDNIGKHLLNWFNDCKWDAVDNGTLKRDDIIAWLEKQGEQSEYNPYKATVKSIVAMVEKYAHPNSDLQDFYNNIKVKCKDAVEYDKTFIEKQGEQKPTDKVEPKFKIGDTVTVKPMSCHGKVFKGEPFKIVDIIEDNYVSDDGKTYSISLQDGWELVEQKSTWSEEDEKMITFIVEYLERLDRPTGNSCITWLKSLKERYTWKPSNEQIKGIKCAIKTLQHQLNVGDKRLNSLYDDLKKLR